MEILLKIGGVYHLLCAVQHIFFPQILRWNKTFAPLGPKIADETKMTLNIMNMVILFFWVMLAYIPFFHTQDLLITGIGKSLLTFIVLFWIFRLFVLQIYYWGVYVKLPAGIKGAVFGAVFFSVGLLLFGIPWIKVILMNKI